MNETNLPTEVRLGRTICGDISQAERREWWLANGLGGYAAGTVAGTLTRRYHGLMIAPVNPPLGRCLIFAKADATLLRGDQAVPLFSNRWADGAIHPQGHVHIDSFHLEGRMPVWRFVLGDTVLEARVWMEPGANTTYLAYRLEAGSPDEGLRLQLRLLVNARDHHGNTWPGDIDPLLEANSTWLRVIHPHWFTLHIKTKGGLLRSEPTWIENFDLPAERERGLADRDNHLCVGEALLGLPPGEWVGMVASLHEDAAADLAGALRRFQTHEQGILQRARAQLSGFRDAPPWVEQLLLATESFIFARPLPGLADGESVIAGYPWFGDWGRDTMIALPGLTLVTGRHASARCILRTFARFVDQGMLPNVFPGAGERAEYNTVDAALWYFEAWRAYFAATADRASLAEVFPVLEAIIDWHVRGTRYRIHRDEADGLLYAGEAGVQLTWMDARIGDWVVTPRTGKPVEVNALWYNALLSMAELARALHKAPQRYEALAACTREGFRRFVHPETGGLFDVLDGPNGHDATLRPNQILAVSLPYSPLEPEVQAAVVRLCGRELLTSYGLRSLVPGHLAFRPRYEGGVWERDGSYHQGPVWTWLLGHYALAEYRVHRDAARAQARLTPIRDHLLDAGLGTVSEIFDGAPPHLSRGTPAQAWSVACVLEAWWRLERSINSL